MLVTKMLTSFNFHPGFEEFGMGLGWLSPIWDLILHTTQNRDGYLELLMMYNLRDVLRQWIENQVVATVMRSNDDV